MLIRRRRLSWSGALVGALMPFCLHGESRIRENFTMTSDDTVRLGNELRANLEREYARLTDTKTLNMGVKGNDVADIIEKYISIGTTFAEAENLLRSAGFTVDPRPSKNPPGNRPDRFAVSGRINSLFDVLFIKVEIIVVMTPPAPGDFSAIAGISAGLFVATI